MLLRIFQVYDSTTFHLIIFFYSSCWICGPTFYSCILLCCTFTCFFFLDKSCLQSGDLKWYFFCPREKKYASGSRMNRATEFGYWKTTGKDRPVHYNDEVVGMIKTLIYHTGRPPRGDRTNWVMHEYRLEEKGLVDIGVVQVIL